MLCKVGVISDLSNNNRHHLPHFFCYLAFLQSERGCFRVIQEETAKVKVIVKLYDWVALTTDVPESFQTGDTGTVVMIHEKGKGYEVEFFTLHGETLGVETLHSNQVRPVEADEVAHVRKIASAHRHEYNI